jgi:anti-sigma-K factor RskA
MEADALHDLTAAYALDALEPEEARGYEAHLARCERCRDELASLSESASALAYATEAPQPPADLRARILAQARSERPNVVPLRPRWIKPVAAVAAVAVCAAIALGIWAVSLSNKLDSRDAALAKQERIAQLLASPGLRVVSTAHGAIAVAAARNGNAALIWEDLEDPGPGLTYEAWVSASSGAKPQPAGLFSGGQTVVVPLDQPVRKGATVLVTKEPAGGRSTPSSAPILVLPYKGVQSA